MKKYLISLYDFLLPTITIVKYLKVDIANILKYKKNAPFSCERLYVNPANIKLMLNPSTYLDNPLTRSDTATVMGGDWDLNVIPFTELDKYKVCHARFLEKKSWKDSNAYDLMLSLIEKKVGADNCYNIDDVILRYNKLDDIFLNIKDSRRLLSAGEVCKKNFREAGGIYIHIGRDGDFIFGLGGCHRLSIAKILDLEEVPVQLGVVHKSALSNWTLGAERIRMPFSFKDYLAKFIN